MARASNRDTSWSASRPLRDDDELVATEAGHGIHGPHAAVQALCHFDQQQVADGVTVLVVERLEVVQVEQDQGTVQPAAFAAGLGLGQAVVEQAPVGELGEAVVIGELADLLLDAFALGDVAMHHDRPAAAGAEGRDGHHEPAFLVR